MAHQSLRAALAALAVRLLRAVEPAARRESSISRFYPAISRQRALNSRLAWPVISAARVSIPFLRAYDRAGTPRWTGWEQGKSTAGALVLCASSRGRRLVRSGHGLAFLGVSDGGNSVFDREPQELTTIAPRAGHYDEYDQTYGVGARSIGLVATLDPVSGTRLAGRFILGRISGAVPPIAAAWDPRDLAVDGKGNLHVVGDAGCCTPPYVSSARSPRSCSAPLLRWRRRFIPCRLT